MKLSVLIVDDNIILNTIQKTLIKTIWPSKDPLTCFDVETALEVIERELGMGRKLLLLLDIHMPVLDGWELLEILTEKAYLNDIWVILNTSSDNHVDEQKAKNYDQVIAYNKKPLTREVLMRLTSAPPLARFFRRRKENDGNG